MKSSRYQYSILSFRTLNKTWVGIFAISVLFVLSYEVLLMNINAPVNWFVGLGKFSSQVAYGYITGYFFYFLTVHLPNVQKRLKLFRYVHNEIAFISSDVNEILFGIPKGEYANNSQELSVQEIDNYLLKLNPLEIFHEKGRPILGFPQLTHANFYSYLSVKGDAIVNKIDKIITFQDVIDIDTLQYLTYISNCFNLNNNIWKGLIFKHTDSKIFSILFMHLPLYLKKLNEASNRNFDLTHKINVAMNKEEKDRQSVKKVEA